VAKAAGPDAFEAALTRDVHGLLSPNRPAPRVPLRVVAPSYDKPTSDDLRKAEFLKGLFDGEHAYDMLKAAD
jgi:hypothetical protein